MRIREEDRNGTWDYPSWFFSLKRFNPGGPTWYGEAQRLHPDLYLQRSVIGIISAALTFLLVLLVILPIIKHRVQSVIVAVNSIIVGVAISLCLVCPEWIRGHEAIQSPIYYHSTQAYDLTLGVHIGLAGFNVTLKTHEPVMHYNEHVKMYHPDNLGDVMTNALERGLPMPLLITYECLTSTTLGFDWSHRLVEAGYHCYILTVFALVGWFLNQVLIAAIPRYSAYGYVIIGYIMIFDTVVYFYWANIGLSQPCIVISDTYVELRHGLCFWACLGVGLWTCIYGLIMTVYDTVHPDKFLSAFDLDYDHKRTLATAHRLNRMSGINYSYREAALNSQQNDPFVKIA